MKATFESTVEKPLKMLLDRELLDARLPIPPSRIFDAPSPELSANSAGAKPPAFQRVLVATDFSCASTRALQVAEKITRALHGKLVALHVNLPVHCDGTCGRLHDSCKRSSQLLRQARDELQEQLHEIGAAACDGIEVAICDGHPHTGIIEEASTRSIDLIVIARHGRSDRRTSLLGKTAEYVVRNAPCPVLLVNEDGAELPHWGKDGAA